MLSSKASIISGRILEVFLTHSRPRYINFCHPCENGNLARWVQAYLDD